MSCNTRHHTIQWKVKKIHFGFIVNFLALGLIFTLSGMNRAEAAITFRAATSVNNQTNSAACTMSKPTGTIKDDVMIAAFQFAKGSSVTPPAGWNVILRTDDTTNSMSVIGYYKLAGASEPASYTWTFTPMSGWCTGGIQAYVGVSTSTPIDVSGGQIGISNSPTIPSLTTTANSDWLISVWAVWNGNLTINLPAGMTSRINFTGGSPHRQADQALGAAGATGTRVSTTSKTAGSWIAQGITIKSASTAPDTTPPLISAINTTATTASGTTMTWTTNEAADSQVEYGLTTSYGSSTPFDTALVTAHTQTLSGLASSTVYHSRVKSRDAAGNFAVSSDFLFTTAADPCAPSLPNPIPCENAKPGNPASEWDVNGAGSTSIQGFSTDISVNRGETVRFKINTTAASYRLDIYRMGYYGGMGARKVATVLPSALLPQNQPPCLTDGSTGLTDCGNWAESASWVVPPEATSGIYFAKLVRLDTGGSSHIFFVVRDDLGTSDILFQTSDTTWQAYNQYGGNSLYVGSPAGRAYKVSYNRPFTTRGNSPEDWVFNAEYPMVRWLEANGYNVSYCTGIDTDRRGAEILNHLNHRVFLSVGHDEYWSSSQRAHVEAARDAGLHLAFFSGNEIFWKTRWENSIDASNTPYRTLVSYKETHANAKIDPLPNVWTGTWRDPRFSPPADGGKPENSLSGTIFTVNCCTNATIIVSEAFSKLRLWRNTSVANLFPGQQVSLSNSILGYEWDEDLDNGSRPGGILRFSATAINGVNKLTDYGSTYATGNATHSLTLYRHPSGALIFGAGTVQWSWGLDGNHDRGGSTPDVRMQQATVNLLADMEVQASTLQGGLVVATTSTDIIAPSSTSNSPAAGTAVTVGSTVLITGTAADSGGGVVGGIEVSTDNGITWHRANGSTSWSYSWTPSSIGTITIKSRAVDDIGNIELPSTGVTVTVGSSDTTPPIVSLTAPTASSTVSGSISVSATASDNTGVAGVQFKLDGANLGAEDTVAPYAMLWDTTTATTGPHTLSALARDAAGNTATSTLLNVTVSNTNDAAQIGQWAVPFSSPIVMVNAVLMHTGKVLAFDDSGIGAWVWDPAVNSFTHVSNNVTDLFCAGQAALPDGRILVAGGHTASTLGTNEANIFDPDTQTWITLPRMAYLRWYPTVTALPDGRMLVTAGDQRSATDFVPFPEVYDPSTNSWTTLTAANLPLPTYPHMFVLPTGKIVATGTTEAAIPTRTLDVTTQTWAMVDARALDGASSVMYRLGLILKVGTASDSGPVRPAAATAYILDMNQPTPAWQQTASMHYPRATTTNLVVVPDGNVMVFGGGTNTSGYDATSQPIYAAEQWSPATQTWRVMASQSKPRLYHAVALLLPDGRVLSSGSGRDTGVTDQLNGEIYSPPYLFQGPRPTITSVPNGAIAYGSSFLVGTSDPDIASIALIRPAAVTHGFDEDQRFVNLSFTPTTGGLTVQAPANANLAPPGYYMLFILNGNGIPSVARFIRFPSSLEDTQPPTPPTNLTAAGAIGSVTLSWTAATDNVGVTGYTIYRSTVSGFIPAVANQVGQAASTTYTDAVPAGTFFYLVEANDATGNFSAASNEASGTSTADTDSPTVMITNPTTGSTVSGTITVLATSTDNVVVAAVQFLLDGAVLGAEVTNSPYALSWSTATATNGPHTLAATARDAAGNTATSSSVTLTVNNTQPAGLVGGFGFNEGAGTTVSDASGGGNTGTIAGASWTTAGKFGNALSFNGTNSYVELSKTNAYDSLTQGTIEAWVKWNGTGYASWFSADSGNCLNPFELAVDNGKLAVWAGPSGCGATFNAYVPIPNPTAWHHLAYVVSSSGNKFYIDGVQQTTTYIIGSAASTFFFASAAGGVTHYNIGRSVNNNGETFNGMIDEVRIYNRALTSAEIQNDMNTPM